jgi:hypothetical protein
MQKTLRGAVEAGNIICLGVDANREEILKFAGDMTAQDFRDAADYEDNPALVTSNSMRRSGWR